MGKHKHRRHDRDSGYGQQQMNPGYNNPNPGMNPGQMGGQNQYMPNGMNQGMGMNPNAQMNQNAPMNQGMGMNQNAQMNQGMPMQNMNPMGNMMNNPLLGLLGGLGSLGGNAGGGMDFNGIMQMLNGMGMGLDPSLLNMFGGGNSGNFDMMQMLGGLLGGNFGAQPSPAAQGSGGRTGIPGVDDLLQQVGPDQMRMLQGILQGLGMNNYQQQSPQAPAQNEKKEDSLEEILANLDFNAILNNLDKQSFFGMEFSNINGDALNDINLDDLDNGEDFDENMGEIKDADIIEENILNKEKRLTSEEYEKIINVLVKLIDPNKIRLLQRIFTEYEKKVENK